MIGKSSSTHAYTPQNISQLLAMMKKEPAARLFAGGTYMVSRQRGKYLDLPKTLISLKNIEELKRIGRTDRFVEIGSCVSINQIITTGKNILPAVLINALKQIGLPLVRNLATIGGNICIPERRLDSFPVLQLLNATVEIRKAGNARWVTLTRLIDENGALLLDSGEVLTRIRIPFESWNVGEYMKLCRNPFDDENSLSFCALVKLQKNIITEFKFGYGLIGAHILRNRDLDAELAGKKVPLSAKEEKYIFDLLQKTLKKEKYALSEYRISEAVHLMKRFIHRISID